jgi:uncharacterized protein (DUF362 family)/Pyruvate/2-oxoacid:ferredoxin oxidoreductase delta subunit
MHHRVALVRHENYEIAPLERSILRAIDLCGFDLASAAGKRVLLKPNMLGAFPPSMAVTTSPAFVAAVGRVFKKNGAQVAVGDSPNGVHTPNRVWEVTGMKDICQQEALETISFEASGSVEVKGRRIARAALEADLLINLPKLKTHGLTFMTLAVKNLFGCINGLQKSGLHRAFPDVRAFSREVVEIAEAVRPALSIVDGIVGMEGDGPSAGTPCPLGVIVAGQDMHRVDEACCNIVGLPPSHLETLSVAQDLGLWKDDGALEMVGDAIEPVEFLLPSTYTRGSRDWWISRLVTRLIFGSWRARPAIDEVLCRRCGLCIDACPVQAMERSPDNAPPNIDYDLCISCLCCHEVCPHKSIRLEQSIGLRIWKWLLERKMKKNP